MDTNNSLPGADEEPIDYHHFGIPREQLGLPQYDVVINMDPPNNFFDIPGLAPMVLMPYDNGSYPQETLIHEGHHHLLVASDYPQFCPLNVQQHIHRTQPQIETQPIQSPPPPPPTSAQPPSLLSSTSAQPPYIPPPTSAQPPYIPPSTSAQLPYLPPPTSAQLPYLPPPTPAQPPYLPPSAPTQPPSLPSTSTQPPSLPSTSTQPPSLPSTSNAAFSEFQVPRPFQAPQSTTGQEVDRCKRPREPLQLKKRKEIIDFKEQNPTVSVKEIAKRFKIPRTTVYGILNSKPLLEPQAALAPDSYRITESRFKILEHLMVIWINNLHSRKIPVKRKTVLAQAQDIAVMLSGLLAEPLPPCDYSSGWFNGFKKRQGIELKEKFHDSSAVTNQPSKCELTEKVFSKYKLDDIFICEITSLFLGLVPLRAQRGTESIKVDYTSASVILCSNVSGTEKIEPLVLVRQSVRRHEFRERGYHEMVFAKGEDLTDCTLLGWIRGMNQSLRRPIALVVDEAIWRLLDPGNNSLQESLSNIGIFKIPAIKPKGLPMRTELAGAFKVAYYRKVLEALKAKSTSSKIGTDLDTFEDYLPLIAKAWDQVVHTSSLGRQQRKRVVLPGAPCDAKGSDDASALCSTLRQAFPGASNTSIDYFGSLEKDTGPSGFLRETILSMSGHRDFTSCIDKLDFGPVRIARSGPKPHRPCRTHERGSVYVSPPASQEQRTSSMSTSNQPLQASSRPGPSNSRRVSAQVSRESILGSLWDRTRDRGLSDPTMPKSWESPARRLTSPGHPRKWLRNPFKRPVSPSSRTPPQTPPQSPPPTPPRSPLFAPRSQSPLRTMSLVSEPQVQQPAKRHPWRKKFRASFGSRESGVDATIQDQEMTPAWNIEHLSRGLHQYQHPHQHLQLQPRPSVSSPLSSSANMISQQQDATNDPMPPRRSSSSARAVGKAIAGEIRNAGRRGIRSARGLTELFSCRAIP